MSTPYIDSLNIALRKAIVSREENKNQLTELRRILVEECGFDQDATARSNPIDLLDGYVRGFKEAVRRLK